MLKINNLTKIYKGGKRAVDGLTMEVENGVIFGFIGHNGAGKTTTLRAAAGILDYDEGEIIIDGISLKEKPVECKKRIAFIPDNPDIYDYMTGIQYLNFIADIFSISAAERKERIDKYAHALGLFRELGDLVSSYSHGMKQKLAVIAALIHEPRLLILDEPFVGLDPRAAHTLKGIMRDLCDRGGAVLFSTHVLDTAEKLCDRIAIIKNGKLLRLGTTDEVRGDESLEDVFLELTDTDGGDEDE